MKNDKHIKKIIQDEIRYHLEECNKLRRLLNQVNKLIRKRNKR